VPVFAAWLLSLVPGITGWLTQFVGKRLAVGAALGSLLVAGWVALQVAAYALWLALDFTMPALMADAMRVVMYLLPSNAIACFNALVSCRLLVWAWDQQREYARAMASIS